jgi:hypothetical protein
MGILALPFILDLEIARVTPTRQGGILTDIQNFANSKIVKIMCTCRKAAYWANTACTKP